MKTNLDKALDYFAKIYYFVRPMNTRISVGTSSVRIKEPRDAVLWLLKIMETEGDSSHGRLFAVLSRSYPTLRPSGFSRLLSEMYRMGLVSREYNEKDSRRKVLRLTAKGEKVLKQIKAQRAELFEELFEGLTTSQRQVLMEALGVLAERSWKKAGREFTRADKSK